MSILNLVIDLALLVLLIVTIIVCTCRGMIKSLFRGMRLILSFLVALALNKILSAWIRDAWLGNVVTGWIRGMVEPAAEGSAELVSTVPNSLKSLLSFFGLNVSQLADDAALQEDAVSSFSSAVASPIANVLSCILAFLAVFVAVWVLMVAFGFLLDKVFRAPGLSTVNRAGGVVIGVICGIFRLWAASQVIIFLGTALAGIPFVAEQFSIENSCILKFFYYFNPIQLLLSLS